ncbi:uncharacterized protein [Prorops nasuta]|uniref:uncharacterized protein n=1 Tax=Prorops nasuta TaxID=863751 RepID=UPI0034CEB4CB
MSKTLETTERGILKRDGEGNIIIKDNGCVICVMEDETEYDINHTEIDFNYKNIKLIINNKTILIPLNDNNIAGTFLLTMDEKYIFVNDCNKENSQIFRWCDDSTKLFISLYKETKDLFAMKKIRTKKALWENISLKMKGYGYDINCIQAKNKYKSSERSYKNAICNNQKSGRGRLTCPYEMELSELLADKHNIIPVALSGNNGLTVNTESFDTISTIVPAEAISEERETLSLEESVDDVEAIEPIHCSKPKPDSNALDVCQKAISRLEESITAKRNIQTEILEEYKQLNVAYRDYVRQLEHANEFRKERNELLK